tara:strand:+ start:10553 stop:11785 length:1233 start_codon:yes stop_codon:yes gene_type:complete
MADTWCKRAEHELILRSFNNEVEAALCCKSQNPVSLFDKGALQKVKEDLKNGIKNTHCTVCWFHESKGIQSWRIIGNLSRINDKTIEVYLDNTCDQACIYCSPKYSSKWSQEVNHASIIDKSFLKTVLNDNTFVETKKQNNITLILDQLVDIGEHSKPDVAYQIILLGGEPLLSPYLKKNVIDDIISAFYLKTNVDRKLKIIIVTNGNTPDLLMDRTLLVINESLEKYKNLKFTINLSMEATDNIAEFVRHGVSWKQFIKNYKKYLDNGVEVGFSMTLNNVTFMNTPTFLKEMIELAKNSNGWRKRTFFKVNVAQYPKFLSIALLPESYRYIFNECKQIIQNNKEYILDNVFFNQFFQDLSFAEDLFSSEVEKQKHVSIALNYFEYLKRTRGTNLLDVNPDLHQYLKENL